MLYKNVTLLQFSQFSFGFITLTRLCNSCNFNGYKNSPGNLNLNETNVMFFIIFVLGTRENRLMKADEAVLTSSHNLCVKANIIKITHTHLSHSLTL